MNKENVAKLVAALRSGEYEQGRNSLRTRGDSYCCLGVACDISGLGKWEKRESALSFDFTDWEYVIRDSNGEKVASDSSTLPAPVAQWLGMAVDGEFYLPDAQIRWDTQEANTDRHNLLVELTSLNDEGMPFEQIADILEHAEAFTWTAPPVIEDDDDEVDNG